MACFACSSHGPADGIRISPALSISFCRECGSGRSDVPPAPELLTAIYDRGYYDAWGLHEAGNRTDALKRATFARRLEHCAGWIKEGGTILDLGCATGSFLREASSRGYQVYGIDISAHAIEQCAATVDRTHLHCGEFDSSTFGNATDRGFDAIFMSDYLEHVLDPRAVLAMAAERLAPGGVVVITTPDAGSVSRRLMGTRWPHFKPEHVSYFSRRGLRRALETSGLAVVDLRPARKSLSITYIAHQFTRYPNPWITGWLAPLRRLLPPAIADAALETPTGEVTAVARKQS
ncbi:MAG: class I SAM-dependent methyltransferase [Gemmatimonadota bacterium]